MGFNCSITDEAIKKLRRLSTNFILFPLKSKHPEKTTVLPFRSPLTYILANVFKRSMFNVISKPTDKYNFLLIKSIIPLTHKSGVYNAPCNYCKLSHINQTKKTNKSEAIQST